MIQSFKSLSKFWERERERERVAVIVHYRSVIVKSNDGHHIINCQLQSESSTVMLGHPSTLCGIAWPSNTSLFLKQNLKIKKKKKVLHESLH